MIPKLKAATVAHGCSPAEPKVLSLAVCGRKVLCGALRTEDAARGGARERIDLRLANALWERHCTLDGSRKAGRISHSLALHRNKLGKPSLSVDERSGPSISFTHIPGTSWAALCHGAQVGIDAAEFREFGGAYSFRRAFHDDERRQAITIVRGTVQEAAALMWSAKEAAVKAAGVGFHLIDPLEVKAKVILLDGQRSSVEVRLERKLEERISDGHGAISVRAFRYRDGWISVALTLSPPVKPEWGAVCGIS
jgi:phosphopantetheinyl transferase (holo-ACP synthase)